MYKQPIYYKIKFIDSAILMISSLSSLVDNLAERIDKIKCRDCDCFFEYESVKGSLIKNKCLSSNKNCSSKPDEKSKMRFNNICKFSNNDIKKFILLLRKAVYPYKYLYGCERFKETSLVVEISATWHTFYKLQ